MKSVQSFVEAAAETLKSQEDVMIYFKQERKALISAISAYID